MTAPVPDRRTGGAAVAGGILLAASVGAELLHPVQEPDGSVVSPGVFAGYLAVWTVGAAALLVAQVGLRRTAGLPGIGRVGAAVALAGTGLLLVFGLVVATTALGTGSPLEAAFIAFAVGLLLLAVGSVLLGLGLRRSGAVGGWWAALPVAAAGALVALLVEQAHDPGLFVLFGAWIALGVRILATPAVGGSPQRMRSGAGALPRRTSPHS
jgi:hypothetical protein